MSHLARNMDGATLRTGSWAPILVCAWSSPRVPNSVTMAFDRVAEHDAVLFRTPATSTPSPTYYPSDIPNAAI